MKSYQINIFTTKETKGTNELSCVIKERSLKNAKEIAKKIIEDNALKYNSIKLQSVVNISNE